MDKKLIKILIVFAGFLLLLPNFFAQKVWAVKFSLIMPTGTLPRDAEAPITINVDTEGQTLTSAQTDVWIDTNYLQYVGVTPGPLFTNVTGSSVSNDTIRLSGSVADGAPGVTGSGVFSTMTVKIIADTSGEAAICQIANPTPTPIPTATPAATSAPNPTTNPPAATQPTVGNLPRTGTAENLIIVSATSLFIILLGIGLRKLQTS